MSRFVLCDRCGEVIKSYNLKHVKLVAGENTINLYDVCENCYDELREFMKPKEEERNG